MSNGNIFISYRREDTAGHAGRLYDRLSARFPGRVFIDVTGISLGEDFVEEIERQVGACGVLVELIGKHWATATDATGKRRLDQPEDLVRLELATALRRGITTIPVLVHGATMPSASTLPAELATLTRRNALEIRESDFDHDVERLIQRLGAVLNQGLSNPPALPARKSHSGWRAWIIGIAIVGLLTLGAIALVLFVSFSGSDIQTAQNANVTPGVPEASLTVTAPKLFVNSRTGFEGDLAEHYIDFLFYYPHNWIVDLKTRGAGSANFIRIERSLAPNFTLENFAVGWYTSQGTFEADRPTFPRLAEVLGGTLARGFPEYRKVSEGPTRINSLDGYEFRFVSVSRETEKGDILLWGRVVFLPTGVSGDKTGATLIMLATSLAPEISGVEDVGVKGEMPIILDFFSLGK